MSRRSSRLLTQTDAVIGKENACNVDSIVGSGDDVKVATISTPSFTSKCSNTTELSTNSDSLTTLINIRTAYKFAKNKKRKDMCDDSIIYCDNDIFMNSYISFMAGSTQTNHSEEKCGILRAYKAMVQRIDPLMKKDDMIDSAPASVRAVDENGDCGLHNEIKNQFDASNDTSADNLTFISYKSCDNNSDNYIISPQSPEIVKKTLSSRHNGNIGTHIICPGSSIEKSVNDYGDIFFVLRNMDGVNVANSPCLDGSISLLDVTAATCTPMLELQSQHGPENRSYAYNSCNGDLIINESSTLIAENCIMTHASISDNKYEEFANDCQDGKSDCDDANDISCSTSFSEDKNLNNTSNNFLAILNRRNLTNFRKVTTIGKHYIDDNSTYAYTSTNTMNNPDTMPYCTGGCFGNEEIWENNENEVPVELLEENSIIVTRASIDTATNGTESSCNLSHTSTNNVINQDDPLNISQWDVNLWSRVSLVQTVLPLPIYIINKIKANGVLLYIASRNFRQGDNIALAKSIELSQQLNVKLVAISIVDTDFLSFGAKSTSTNKSSFQYSMDRKRRVFFDKFYSYKKLLSSKFHIPYFLLHSGSNFASADEACIICDFIDDCLEDNVVSIITDDYCNGAIFHKVWKRKENVPIFLVNNNIADNLVGIALSEACGSAFYTSVSPYFDYAEKFVNEAISNIESDTSRNEMLNIDFSDLNLFNNHNCQVNEAEKAIKFNASSSKNDFTIVDFNEVEEGGKSKKEEGSNIEHFEWNEEDLLLYFKKNVVSLNVLDESEQDKSAIVCNLLEIEKFRQIVLNGLMLGIISPFFVLKFAQTNNPRLYNSNVKKLVAEFEVIMIVSSCFNGSTDVVISPEAMLSKYIATIGDNVKVHIDTFNPGKKSVSQIFFPQNLRKGATNDLIFNYIQNSLVLNGLFYDGLFFNYYFLFVLMNIKSAIIAMKIVLYEVVSYITYNHSKAGDNVYVMIQVLYKYHRLQATHNAEVTHTNLIDYIYSDSHGSQRISVDDIINYIDANL